MSFVFQRRLTMPLWAIAFLTVGLTAPPTATLFLLPPTTVFAMAAIGIAAIVFLMPRAHRVPVRVIASRHRDHARAASAMTAATGVRTVDELNRRAADDALDLVRMDDDGGWQMARPPVQRRRATVPAEVPDMKDGSPK